MSTSPAPAQTSGAASAAPAPPRPAHLADRVKIKLDFPIDVSGVMTDTVTMRRPKVRDRMAVLRSDPTATDQEWELRFLANLCDLIAEDIEAMDFIDYNKLQAQLSSFTSSAPQTTSKTR